VPSNTFPRKHTPGRNDTNVVKFSVALKALMRRLNGCRARTSDGRLHQAGINTPQVHALDTRSFRAALRARAPFVTGGAELCWPIPQFLFISYVPQLKVGSTATNGPTTQLLGISWNSGGFPRSRMEHSINVSHEALRFASWLQTRYDDDMHSFTTLIPALTN